MMKKIVLFQVLIKFVILEHPTYGLDPKIRRSLWNVLSNEKMGRHILVTSHLPNEVDIIGDRIAIISEGQLEFNDTSIAFKKRFGKYRLICVKGVNYKNSAVASVSTTFHPDIIKEKETKDEIHYQLASTDKSKFGEIFELLEKFSFCQEIKTFSVSQSSAEFALQEFSNYKQLETDETTTHLIDEYSNVHGAMLILYQFLALLRKRFIYYVRDMKSFVLYNLAVIILLIPLVIDFRSFISRGDLPSLEISIESYKNPFAFYEELIVTNETKNLLKRTQIGYKAKFEEIPNANLLLMSRSDLLKWTKTSSLQRYRFQFIFGFVTTGFRSICVNGIAPIHAEPLSLHYFGLSALYPNANITIINAPVNKNVMNHLETSEFTNMEVFGIEFPIFIAIIMSIMSSSNIVLYIEERECYAKAAQFRNGVGIFFFWISSILFDLILSVPPITLIIVTLILSGKIYWGETGTLVMTTYLLLMFTFAMAPIICLLSRFFSNPSTGVKVASAVNTFIAMAFFVNNYGNKFISDRIKPMLGLIPICALIESLSTLSNIGKQCQHENDETDHPILPLCKTNSACCPSISLLWNENAIQNQKWTTVTTYLISFIILLISEKLKRPLSIRIRESLQQLHSINLNLKEISKSYGNFLAVDKVSLDIQNGECVGLFGCNGSGKTTILKMLTGEERISSGKVVLLGSNDKWCSECRHYMVGFCPQIDMLHENLTVLETVRIYSMLRGIQIKHALRIVHHLELGQYMKQYVSKLSGGNKHKLSMVIALIGNPSVLFLDQPTSFVDISSKRKLWNILKDFRDRGKLIILASDCMKEYEELCTRLVTVVNKDKIEDFAPTEIGLQIKVETVLYEKSYTDDVNSFVLTTFMKAKLISKYKNILTYEMPISGLKWSQFFNIIEERKNQIQIDDYFVYLR